ncbi:DUF721 domain-containing protein [Wenxinia marina]|uniref:RNA-binding protein n=1 Tax=Wenxinia marina DSM 24838 TaxID=1123501 RepID=A0A0D0Q9R5_9RHOB|nr:DUF721 domain-containing protein [Wenxinia marina]KIQ71164.1 hypothetical protein Wenmar_00543 [Wenxinia marina DSM 24838]GGL54345.1 hypothetical protein GCM10011392_05950 [Wenxinia marina]
MTDQRRRETTTYGFAAASRLLEGRVRKASESRGFAESRLLTHWAEIVGEATAAICRPVEVSYARGGMGATLTLLTTGAQAPMLEMQLPQLQEKVNACYGYRAIARIRITQTAPTGFAEGQARFARAAPPPPPLPDRSPEAAELTGHVTDTQLRLALEALGTKVLRKP